MLGVAAVVCFAGNAWAAEASAEGDAAGAQTPGSSAAADKDNDADKTKDADKDEDFGHGRQFGLRAGPVGGYRMVFRYDNTPYCTPPDAKKAPKDQQKICGFGAPLALDVAASFALLDGLEPFLWARFGLQHEAKTDTLPQLLIGVGARIYTMSDSAFKIFIEPAIAYEFEGGGDNPLWQTPGPNYDPQYKKDLVFHLAAGPQLDFAKYVGAYLDAGLTTGVLRGISTTMELQLGLQFRAP